VHLFTGQAIVYSYVLAHFAFVIQYLKAKVSRFWSFYWRWLLVLFVISLLGLGAWAPLSRGGFCFMLALPLFFDQISVYLFDVIKVKVIINSPYAE
jgi:hypothetical protein